MPNDDKNKPKSEKPHSNNTSFLSIDGSKTKEIHQFLMEHNTPSKLIGAVFKEFNDPLSKTNINLYKEHPNFAEFDTKLRELQHTLIEHSPRKLIKVAFKELNDSLLDILKDELPKITPSDSKNKQPKIDNLDSLAKKHHEGKKTGIEK